MPNNYNVLTPFYEPAYCHLMRLDAQEGDRASVLRVYHQSMTTLQAELGVNPSPTTCKLYEELLTQEESSPPTCVAQEEIVPPVGSDSVLMPPPVRLYRF
ncbi:bacterial transcriptional activator domain-containing protein [Parathermosynechococcus lividus]